MKTYNVKNRLSSQAKQEINRIIETHDKYSKSYFFNPAKSAEQRRSNERKFHKNNPCVAFETKQGLLEVVMTYDESCNNVYYKLNIYLNGELKNISAIKKLLK